MESVGTEFYKENSSSVMKSFRNSKLVIYVYKNKENILAFGIVYF